ncbi:MAG TPA: hypothetical protein VGY66_11360 [Gemmataceae bacterium]|jgi:hypothetical protein|nr:hypothetical protein [Gemmataceae bacterium]
MKIHPWCSVLVILISAAAVSYHITHAAPAVQDQATPALANAHADERGQKPDSFLYYGPNGLWKYWHDPANMQASSQRLGRDTWIHWTWGNQKFLRKVAVLAGQLPVPISSDFFRALDSRNHGTRFRDLGFINEPNCEQNNQPDEYGFYLDTWKGDPLNYYPGDPQYQVKYPLTYPSTQQAIDGRHYGRPSGVLGLRLFSNPKFDDAAKSKWSIAEYFKNPGKVEPPYLVGFSCAFCHIAFDPNNPPPDPEKPRWEHLAANIGNQYLREGELFLGKGRVVFGDKHPDPAAPGDPYKTRGLTDEDFLYQYAATQQPGTSETSRISYDFINNPNTINAIYNLGHRVQFKEIAPNGQERSAMHILKDGADSIGVKWALMRVPINIGCEGEYWIDRLFNPVTGRPQRPFRIAEVLAGLPEAERKKLEQEEQLSFKDISPERFQALKARYRSEYGHEEFGEDWQEAWRRNGSLAAYLTSYGPSHLKDAAGAGNPTDAKAAVDGLPKDEGQLTRGAELFALQCARCHSNKQPDPTKEQTKEQQEQFFRKSVAAADFLAGNTLTDDRRYPVTEIRTNMARALATNAVDGDIWAEFSSRDYKALPPVGRITLDVPVFQPNAPPPWRGQQALRIDFEPRGGGRGYYRTPSLVSLWATAPYFHNNALGDYYVVKDDGAKSIFPNDGRRIGRQLPDGSWIDFRIDVSVAGRLKMFEDGMDKLFNPWKRHHWLKRTSADSTFIPDLENSAQQLLVAVAKDVVRQELSAWLKNQQFPPKLIDDAVQAGDSAVGKVAGAVFEDGRTSLRFGWAALQMRLHDHADRLYELIFEDLQTSLADKLQDRKPLLANLKPLLRQAFMAKLDALDKQIREAALLKIPAGTPLNLYANLNSSVTLFAALTHLRLRGDPRALAEALLQLSDCPDLVEDSGHLYGSDLTDAQKNDLVAFLKTL